jgi:hypothetical protein
VTRVLAQRGSRVADHIIAALFQRVIAGFVGAG